MIRLFIIIFLLSQSNLLAQNKMLSSMLKKNKISLELVSYIDFSESFSLGKDKVSDELEGVLRNKKIKIENNSRYVISLSHGWTYKRDVELIIDNYKGVIIDTYNDDNVIALFESSKAKNLKESLEALISFLLVENNKISPSENKKFIDVTSHFKNIQAFSWDSSRPDSHAPIGILGDHTHSKKDVMLSYRFHSEIKSNNLNGNTLMSQEHVIEILGYDKYVSSSIFNTHSIEFMYGITDDVTLMSLFSYHSNMMKVIKKNPIEYNSSGMGDIEFQFLMNFFKKRFFKVHSNVGFKLPFGSINKKFNEKLLPYPMQLGSGSLSILLGFTGLFQSKKISGGFQPLLNVSTNTNSRGYSYGNLFNINYWLSYKLSKIISLSYRQQNIINSKINGMDEDLDPWDISLNNTNNSSYEIIQSFFGLNTSILKGVFKNFRFSVEYAVPLYQNYDGIQMGLDGKFIAGIQFSPGGHKHH